MRDELTGKEKAAILLISLGPDVSSDIFKHLDDEEVEKLTLEIANQNKIDPETKKRFRKSFCSCRRRMTILTPEE